VFTVEGTTLRKNYLEINIGQELANYNKHSTDSPATLKQLCYSSYFPHFIHSRIHQFCSFDLTLPNFHHIP
jgi:hypothetical protein